MRSELANAEKENISTIFIIVMNSYTSKQCPQENISAEQSKFSEAKNTELSSKGRDNPFPNKPVCIKRLVNPTSHDLLDHFEKICVSKKSQEHIPDSIKQIKDSSRPPAGELQMTREIHEKQFMLLNKLWKVEDALQQRIQRDNVGVNVKGNQKTAENKFYGRETDTKFKKTEVTGSEMLIQNEQNPKQHKFRQDTITKKHKEEETKWDNQPAGHTVSKGTVETRVTYVYNEKTPPKNQEKANHMLVTGYQENTKRTGSEELVLPQVSSPSLKLELAESPDKNVQHLQCKICNRKFMHNRLEKHVQICKKVNTSKRHVFNSYMQRTKETAAAEFWKTHSKSRTPEVLRKKKQRQHNKN